MRYIYIYQLVKTHSAPPPYRGTTQSLVHHAGILRVNTPKNIKNKTEIYLKQSQTAAERIIQTRYLRRTMSPNTKDHRQQTRTHSKETQGCTEKPKKNGTQNKTRKNTNQTSIYTSTHHIKNKKKHRHKILLGTLNVIKKTIVARAF